MTGGGARDGQSGIRGTVGSWLQEIFRFNTPMLNWPRGVLFLDVMLVPLMVFWAIGHEVYLLSALFGAIFAVVVDPGGPIARRALRMGVFALVGAGLTAVGFSLDAAAWGWLVLASFLVTAVASLAVTLGVHAMVAALLLNVWFIIAVAFGQGLHQHPQIDSHTWAQVVAWVGGSALWITTTFVVWLVVGRRDLPPPVPEIPGDTTRRRPTQAMIAFAVIRGLAIGGGFALAFGLNLSHGLWLPIATIIAMKPSLRQSTVAATQRIIGALLGAAAAALLLLIPAHVHGIDLFSVTRGLEVVAIVLLMHAIAIRLWNYALYTAAIAAAVLVLEDLPQPTNYSAEGYRVAWTLSGVAIGVLVALLATRLAKRRTARS
jgi:hypothetical protein